MKVALITDQHFGARSDSLIFDDYFQKFYNDIFFPELDRRNIDTVIGLGDLFDRRKYINFNILNNCKRYYFDELARRGITLHEIIGNHDTYFKGTNEVNSPWLVLREYTNIHAYSRATDISINGTSIGIVPWICSGNAKESFEFLETTRSQLCFGHLEIAGFQMHRGSVSEHGYAMDLFSKFDMVFSGHFHHKSSYKNINYLGAPYEMTWADYDDPRGFHIFDLETRELEHVINPYFIHNKVIYSDKDVKSLDDITVPAVNDSYVKLYVKDKTNPYWFDLFIDKLEKQGLLNLQVIDEGTVFDTEDDFLEDVEDTPTLIRRCVESLESSVPSETLTKFMLTLHNEALEIE
jgi:DNA repair exonuclease SbcCD nuclease subunit